GQGLFYLTRLGRALHCGAIASRKSLREPELDPNPPDEFGVRIDLMVLHHRQPVGRNPARLAEAEHIDSHTAGERREEEIIRSDRAPSAPELDRLIRSNLERATSRVHPLAARKKDFDVVHELFSFDR